MRKPTFDQSDVIEAAIELQKQNKKITGYALSKVLGGGRPDRLESIWKEHLLTQQEQPNKDLDACLSADLESIFNNLSESLIGNLKSLLISCEKHMNTQSTARIEKEQLRCAERVTAMEEQLRDANSVINQQEDEIEQLLAKQHLFNQDQSIISELEKQLAVLNTKIEIQSESLRDKERVISEQEARIKDFTQFNALLSQETQLVRSEL